MIGRDLKAYGLRESRMTTHDYLDVLCVIGGVIAVALIGIMVKL